MTKRDRTRRVACAAAAAAAVRRRECIVRRRSRAAARRVLAGAAAVTMLAAPALCPAETWDNNSGDNQWSTPSNWADNTEPDGSQVCTFPGVIPGSDIITLQSGEAAAGLDFQNNYTLTGGQLTLPANATIATASGVTATLNSSLASSGGVLITGPGQLSLGGENSFSGTVRVSSATLAIDADSRLGDFANSVELSSGGTLRMPGGTIDRNIVIGSGGGRIQNTGGQLSVYGSVLGGGSSLELNGLISLRAGSTRTGPTSISDGTTAIEDGTALGSGAATVQANSSLWLGANVNTATPVTLTNTASMVFFAGGQSDGTVTVLPGASVMLSVAFAGTKVLGNGPNDLTGGSATSHINVFNGAANSVLQLGQPSDYPGNWTVTFGTLRVAHASALGTATSPVIVTGVAQPGGSVSGAVLEIANATLGRDVTLEHASTLRGTGAGATTSGIVRVPSGAQVTLASGAATGDVLTVGPNGTGPALTGGTGGSRITVTGSGTVRLTQATDYVGNWTVAGGTLDAGTDGAVGGDRLGGPGNSVTLAGGTISFNGGSTGSQSSRIFFANGGGFRVTNSAHSIGALLSSGPGGGFTKTGLGALRVFSSQSHGVGAVINVDEGSLFMFNPAGTAAVHNLTVNVNAGGHFRLLEHNQDFLHGLHIADGGLADYTPAGTGVLQVDSITATGSGKLDLTSNKLIVKNAATDVGTFNGSAYTGVTALIASGHNEGTWDGGGIVTSMPDAAAGLTALGIATAEQTGDAGGTFGGVSVSASDVLVMYTYAGDANLDGAITGDDYSVIDFNIAVPGASGWYNGDFNYDGIISGDDYSVIDFNIVAQGAPFPTGSVSSSRVAVPEPTLTAAGALVWTLAAVRRARRRN